MSPYSAYPSLDALPITERVDAFRRTCIGGLERRELTTALMEEAFAEAIENEQYELAQGITAALEQWRQFPQLALF